MPTAEETFILQPLTQRELDLIIQKHEMFLTGKPGGARAVVRDRDLSGLNLSGKKLSQSDFTGCILCDTDMTTASFDAANLFGCDLSGAKMRGIKLVRADLRGAEIENADLRGADLTGADLREGAVVLRRKSSAKPNDTFHSGAKAGAVSFRGSNLTGAILTNVVAIQTDFTNADLSDCIMHKANFRDALFSFCDLSNSDFQNADIRDADFRGSIMTGTKMNGVENKGAEFVLTLVDNTQGQDFSEIDMTLDELVIRHMAWVASGGKSGKQLDVSNIDMRKAGSIAAKKLTALRAAKATFAGTNMAGVEMQSATLENSDFRKCVMTHVDLRGANLAGALLVRANASNGNFDPLVIKRPDGSDMTRVTSFQSANLTHGNFTGARMRQADFRGADLAHAVFENCDLRGADFTNAHLYQAVFKGAILTDAIFDPHAVPENAA